MKKSLVTTTVYYHNGANPIVFADAVDNGETVRYGTTVRKQILDKETVDAVGTTDGGDPTHFVIPSGCSLRMFSSPTIGISESFIKIGIPSACL